MPDSQTTIAYDELLALVAAIFVRNGLSDADARQVAGCLVDADLRGVPSHGVNRTPIYTRRLREGLVNPAPAMSVLEASPVAARVDGDNGMGFVVGQRAMDEAVARARTYGVGLVWAFHSNHFGMATSYLLQAVADGMAAMVMTNASKAMPIWGSTEPFLGTSPFALAAPGGTLPLVLDMATSVAARGKIRRAAQDRGQIPAGWALDAEGRPTTDAEAAYNGILLPVGGPKGSGLSLMMEAMAGVMSGAAFGGEVGNQYFDMERPQNVGHLFMAMRPNLFMPQAEYEARLDALVERAKATPLAAGFDEILMPGERETRLAVERMAKGVPIPASDLEMLRGEAEGVPGVMAG